MPGVDEISFASGGGELLDSIALLWKQLRDHHSEICPNFGHQIAARTFEQRKIQWLSHAQRDGLSVDLARITDQTVGYCVTIIDAAAIGEVDSLFVLPAHRRRGIGDSLMKRALQWLDDRGVHERIVEVVAGNEPVFAFYARYGFLPRRTILKQL